MVKKMRILISLDPFFSALFQRFGFTVSCPDDHPVPSGALDLYRSHEYWILSASTVHHNGQERRVDFNLESLRVGQSVGCLINKEGELHYFVDGKDQGVAWTGVPIDRPMWGFADIYGLARKIKSEFLCGKWKKGVWDGVVFGTVFLHTISFVGETVWVYFSLGMLGTMCGQLPNRIWFID